MTRADYTRFEALSGLIISGAVVVGAAALAILSPSNVPRIAAGVGAIMSGYAFKQ